MTKLFNLLVRPTIRKWGLEVVRLEDSHWHAYPADFSPSNTRICDAVKKYTMTTPERVNAVIEAVRYVVANRIDGALVECGVWKGGSTMAMALTLREMGDESREIWLYDTFSGMSPPLDVDVSIEGSRARDIFAKARISDQGSEWCLSTIEEVTRNVTGTEYPRDRFRFIRGKVENTIPGDVPREVALLRLDTDWYESTKHELVHLFPLIAPRGVLIIDDYGYWEGARRAVDEYVSENNLSILLNRIDASGRVGVKLS